MMFGNTTTLGGGKRYPLGKKLLENDARRERGLPGVISGFGGGTWNTDGSVATPVSRMGEDPMAQPDPAYGASAIGWDEGGTDTLPALPPPNPSPPTQSLPTAPMGMFGNIRGATATSALPATRVRSGGFDYDTALASMLPQQRKRSTLQKIAGVVAPALMGLAGNQAGANAFFANQQARRDADERQRSAALGMIERWKHEDFARQDGADLRASAPRVIGRSMVQYDPNSGGVSELYDGPEDFESYAEAMGIEPGTQEYFDAVEDYVLKSDGPTAYERDKGLDDYRTGNRLRIEGARQGNRESLEGLRQRNRVATRGLPTYRDVNPRAGRARPTATGPNGQKVEWNGKAWVPAT